MIMEAGVRDREIWRYYSPAFKDEARKHEPKNHRQLLKAAKGKEMAYSL